MRLLRVEIENFRSIRELEIDFSNIPCRILAGINESGKSNILKALALLNKTVAPTKDDIRIPRPDEPPIRASGVRFVFRLDETETGELIKAMQIGVMLDDPTSVMFFKKKEAFSLEGFCRSNNEGIWFVDVITGKRLATTWTLDDEWKLEPGWKKPSAHCTADFRVAHKGSALILKNVVALRAEEHAIIPESYLTDFTLEDVFTRLHSEIAKRVNEALPECIYWTYDEKNLLPTRIGLSGFAASPRECLPLQRMFELAGALDISKTVAEARQTPYGVRNLLKRIAEIATKHLHEVWQEYKHVRIDLQPNGDDVDASVLDDFNHFSFATRSDGFKRFVTFLLLISGRVRARNLTNCLLLIDEPENSLHPSGARYLRDELIRISGANNVLYSTYSVFMIDKEKIERHLIVQKINEITEVEEVDASNIVDEEVIYNALGHSVYEVLKKKNIIFEGWRDKRLFQVALEGLPDKFKAMRKTLEVVGRCHAEGVKDIQRVVSFLELANRDYLIVSDNDKPAREKQLDFEKTQPGGSWRRYDQLFEEDTILTGEDFIKPEIIADALDVVRKAYAQVPVITPAELTGRRLEFIKGRMKAASIPDNEIKKALNLLKETLFSRLEPKHITASYLDLLSSLAKTL
jgi:hypothetical protein